FSHRPQILVTPESEPFTNLKYQLQLHGFSVEDLASDLSKPTELILFFDQFEEVITQCHTPKAEAERRQLFDFLDILTNSQNKYLKILVICSFRSDFLSQLANYNYIKSQHYVFPVSSLDYKVHAANWERSMMEIITKPALKNGVIIEKEQVRQLLNQIKEVEGVLPILQFTLRQLWSNETIKDRYISATEYIRLSEGKGIAGIIETHAENVITRITNNGKDKTKEMVLKSIFVNLVEVNENFQDVKKTVDRDELFRTLKGYPKNIVWEVFETLVSEKSRLLHVTRNKDGSIKVNLIHEELIRKWKRLKEWINERRGALRYKKKLTHDIVAYHSGEEHLYRGKKLKIAWYWKTNNPDLSNDKINAFLYHAQKRKIHRRYKRVGGVLLFFILLFVVKQTMLPYYNKKNVLSAIKRYELLGASDGIESMTSLTINEGNYLLLSKNIQFFKKLKHLYIEDLKEKGNLIFLQQMDYTDGITSLSIKRNTSLNAITGIEKLKNLDSLTIESNHYLQTLEGIEKLTNLKFLAIKYNNGIPNLEGLRNLKNLGSLTIESNRSLYTLEGIENLPNLKSLSIAYNLNFGSLTGIEKLSNLKSLLIIFNNSLVSLKGIEKLTQLKSLKIEGPYNPKSIAYIKKLNQLELLSISVNDKLTNLESIKKLTQLN
ncbi:MAG: hypothetical protein AAF969_17685, partial [Bacteroidota bacterium]